MSDIGNPPPGATGDGRVSNTLDQHGVDKPPAHNLQGWLDRSRVVDLEHEYWPLLRQTTFADLAPLLGAGVGGAGLAIGPAVASITVEKWLWHLRTQAATWNR